MSPPKHQKLMGTPVEHMTRMMFTRMVASLARHLKDEELSLFHLAALHLIYEDGPLRVTKLGEELGLSPSSSSRLVDGLVDRLLVARTEAEDDRRAKVLSLTDAGRGLVDRASEDRLKVFAENVPAVPLSLARSMFAMINSLRPNAQKK